MRLPNSFMTRLRHSKLLMPSLVLGCFLLLTLGVMALGISAVPGGALEAPARVSDDAASHREIAESPAAKKAPAPPDPPPDPKSPSEALRDQVLGILSGSTAEVVTVSIEVDGLGRIVDHNGSTGVIPASTQKLYTSAATLLTLGPDFRYTTRVLAKGDLRPDGSLGGDLILVAGGDPSLTKADLDALAVRVAQAGIRAVEGSLLVDDTRYDRMRTVAEWEPRYMPEDIGPLSAMVVDSNEWTKHPAFLADPALGNLSLFRASLNSAGVALAGPDALGVAPEGAGEVAGHQSPPLSTLLPAMLRESDNLAAELMIKEIGRTFGDPTTAGGIRAMDSVIAGSGADPAGSVDGSGLSRANRKSTGQLLDFILRLEGTAAGDFLRSWLPSSCTAPHPGERPAALNKRLCGTAAAGQVAAKTGFLKGVRSLAGHTQTASGRRVWFSVVLMNYTSRDLSWAALDQTLVAVSSFNA